MSSFAPGQTEFRRSDRIMDNVHVIRRHHQKSLNGLERNLPETNKQSAELAANDAMSRINVLMVAEKPFVARSIAELLSGGLYTSWKGWNGACSVSEYKGTFREQQANFKVTSTCGHVMGVDFPAEFNSWNRVDPAKLFDCQIERKEANTKLKIPEFLASVAENCNYLVLWLDCDKEGENICFEVMEAVRASIRPPNGEQFMDVVFRAHFSAITDQEIEKAMANLGKPNFNQSLSVDARQELDLRIGCAFTRFQSRFFQYKYGDLDSNLISFGPCQTPTLAFCVHRHEEILRFVPQPYWILQMELELELPEQKEKRTLKLEWIRDRQFDKTMAQNHFNKIKNFNEAKVLDVSQREDERGNPVALNTLGLLRHASSFLGLSPIETMSVAERLYTRGYISYPRTETTAYPESFDFILIIRQLDEMPQFNAITRQLLLQSRDNEKFPRPKNGINKGDHPPITPIRSRDRWLRGDDKRNELRVYEYIAQHFLATLMPICKYITKTVKFTINEEQFLICSREVTDPGFTAVFKWMDVTQEKLDSTQAGQRLAVTQKEMLDRVHTGQRLIIKKAQLVERMTAPPDFLTESELIMFMDVFGIGTDGSIPAHINNLCLRNYVKVETGRQLVPTKLGIALIKGYKRVDPDLILPTMRADFEKQLDLIAKGKVDYESMKIQVLEAFRKKFHNFMQNINLMDALFADSFKTLAECRKTFSKCGKCNKFMELLIETRPKRLYCPTCQQSYSVPSFNGSSIHHHFDRTCPVDGFELLYCRGAGGKLSNSFAFCPHCFNDPPFEDMHNRKLGCNECSHPECPNSYKTQGVLPCRNRCAGGSGMLVLDPQSGPRWRLSCNKCPAVVGLFEGASKLRVLLDRCEGCEARRVHVEYKDSKSSKLPGQSLQFDGCIFCEQHKVTGCIDLNHAFITHSGLVGLRGSGRGRGERGGIGRGRGGGGGGRERSGSDGRGEGCGRGRGRGRGEERR